MVEITSNEELTHEITEDHKFTRTFERDLQSHSCYAQAS